MSSFFRPIADAAAFQPAKAAKADLFRGDQLFVGLNCFEPGQAQPAHTHAGADKFYLVISGKARMTVGAETRVAEAGTVVWAPADVPARRGRGAGTNRHAGRDRAAAQAMSR